MKSNKRAGFFIILLIIVAIAAALYIFISRIDLPSELNQDQSELIKNFIADNQLKVDITKKEAFVSPTLWNMADYSLKQTLATTLAAYCGSKTKPIFYKITIKDKMSGKLLAKYNPIQGLKVTE